MKTLSIASDLPFFDAPYESIKLQKWNLNYSVSYLFLITHTLHDTLPKCGDVRQAVVLYCYRTVPQFNDRTIIDRFQLTQSAIIFTFVTLYWLGFHMYLLFLLCLMLSYFYLCSLQRYYLHQLIPKRALSQLLNYNHLNRQRHIGEQNYFISYSVKLHIYYYLI